MTRSQERYDAFATAVDTPMLVLTILWLPVLIVPLASAVHGSVATTFSTIDYTVWALFSLEYIIKLWLPRAGGFFKTAYWTLDRRSPVLSTATDGASRPALRLARVGVVLAEGLRRAESILTHNGFHFVVLAAGVLVFASAGLVTFVERNAHGSEHSQLRPRNLVGHCHGDHGGLRRPIPSYSLRARRRRPAHADGDRAHWNSDGDGSQLFRAREDGRHR